MPLYDDLKAIKTDADALQLINTSTNRARRSRIRARVDTLVAAHAPAPPPPPPPPPDPEPPPPPPPPPDPPPSGARLQPANIMRIGSFRVPNVSAGQADTSFAYGGLTCSITPRKTLLLSTHPYHQYLAELSIPSIGGTAGLIGSVTELQGNITGSGQVRIGGHLQLPNGQLLYTKFRYYDADHGQVASHFVKNWPGGGVLAGPIKVGSLNPGFYSGYMCPIPAAWQSALGGDVITGNCCLSILGRTSFGPSAHAVFSDRLGAGSKPLVYYPEKNQTLAKYGVAGQVSPIFNGATKITGVIFPDGTDTVLFTGMTGTGPYWYGDSSQGGRTDPYNPYKGEHAPPYRAWAWAYDAHDLADVAAGRKAPYDVKPYANWDLGLSAHHDFGFGGSAYDPATKRFYCGRSLSDGEKPVIEVFEIR